MPAAAAQNTGVTPKADPRTPKISGMAVWLALIIAVRRPTAAPVRPAAAVEGRLIEKTEKC